MLKFSPANAKLRKLTEVKKLQKFLNARINGRIKRLKVYSMDILSGWSCPFADQCKSKAVVQLDGSRKIEDGPNTQFRCFSASQEAIFSDTYNLRKHNFDLLKACKSADEMADLIESSMPKDLGICRIHVAGDFFNRDYLQAWAIVAARNPKKLFYAYTKSLGYWVELRETIPANFVLTASYGGRLDHLIVQHNLRFSKVIYHPSDAGKMVIDHDDSHAARPDIANKSFALLIHGIQPKGSAAANALRVLKQENIEFEYSR